MDHARGESSPTAFQKRLQTFGGAAQQKGFYLLSYPATGKIFPKRASFSKKFSKLTPPSPLPSRTRFEVWYFNIFLRNIYNHPIFRWCVFSVQFNTIHFYWFSGIRSLSPSKSTKIHNYNFEAFINMISKP